AQTTEMRPVSPPDMPGQQTPVSDDSTPTANPPPGLAKPAPLGPQPIPIGSLVDQATKHLHCESPSLESVLKGAVSRESTQPTLAKRQHLARSPESSKPKAAELTLVAPKPIAPTEAQSNSRAISVPSSRRAPEALRQPTVTPHVDRSQTPIDTLPL